MTIRAVIFDKDGVLVDFHATWGKASRSVILDLAEGDEGTAQSLADAADFDLETCIYKPNAAFIAGAGGEILNAWKPILGDKADRLGQPPIFKLFTDWGHKHVTAAPALAETLAALRALDLPLGVATNDFEDSARLQMTKLSVDHHFTLIMGADSGHGAKPGPGMLHHFAAQTQIDPSEMIMIGDTMHDINAAKAAGAIGVGIGTGPGGLAPIKDHADHVVQDLSELPALVQRLSA